MPNYEDEKVVAPGGRRSRASVHQVEAGQAVTGAGQVIADPHPTAPAQATTLAAADEAWLMYPAGHTPGRSSEPLAPEGFPAAGAMFPAGVDLVVTPGGYRPRRLVHLIDADHTLDTTPYGLRQLHPSGRVVREFAAIRPHTDGRPLMPANVNRRLAAPGAVPDLGEGWIAYGSWVNDTGSPTTRFATTWVVPPAPTSDDDQTLFLFNSIMNSTMIYQPVLQWGVSAAGGGSYWAVASWYADGLEGQAFHSPLVPVETGDVLVGVMTQTGHANGQFSYYCEFVGITGASLPISNVEELTWHTQTLEAYALQVASDYPATSSTAFTGIDVQTTAGRPALNWTAVDAVTDVGQSARVVSDANPGGEVDIYYGSRILADGCTAAATADGQLAVLIHRTDGDTFMMGQTSASPGGWSTPADLGGIVLRPVVSALNTDGRLEVFGIGTDHAAWLNSQDSPDAGPWHGWTRLGGWASELAIGANSDGRLELFGIGNDHAPYHMWQQNPQAGPWSGWTRLGGWVNDICVSRNSDGALEVFGIGSDNALYNMRQQSSPAGPWTSWNRLGGWVSAIASTINSDGRLEVFGIGADGALYEIWQQDPHSGQWSGWNRLGGWTSAIAPICNSDGRLEVFGIGSDHALYSMWQQNPHAGPWSGWNRLGGWVSAISVERNSDGRLEVFGIGSDQGLYHIWQQHPHSAPWSSWTKLT